MQADFFGPRYCETPEVFTIGAFPVEPFNTYSNLAIIFFAFVGFAFTLRRAPRAVDLYILCTLLLATGLGSFFWHGLRDWYSLQVDVTAGLLFLIALFFLWARRVMPLWQALVFFAGFYAAIEYFDYIDLIPYGRWASMMPAILIFGGYLIYRTAAFTKAGAIFGAFGVILSSSALTFRTIDRFAVICDTFQVGTHFLWHAFLSAAALMGILAIISVSRASRAAVAKDEMPSRTPFGAPAE
jgi:hypothetical protein